MIITLYENCIYQSAIEYNDIYHLRSFRSSLYSYVTQILLDEERYVKEYCEEERMFEIVDTQKLHEDQDPELKMVLFVLYYCDDERLRKYIQENGLFGTGDESYVLK